MEIVLNYNRRLINLDQIVSGYGGFQLKMLKKITRE